MSGGRWVRQDNGDYQHFTDGEYNQMLNDNARGSGVFFVFIGLLAIFFTFDKCDWGNLKDFPFIFFCMGCIFFIYGIFTCIGAGMSIGNIIGGILIWGIAAAILAGIGYYIIKSGDEDEKKEENKTEQVSQAPSSANTQSNMASFKAEESNETVEAYEEPDYEEEAEENYSSNENTVDDRTDVMPEFPGGSKALMNYLNANIRFPSDAEENGIQGKVVVSYVIDIDGSVTDVQVVQSVYPSLDKEAMRVVKNMPKWIPGRQDGKAVQVKYSIPINFYYQ